ncbi:MAG TPA: rhodanese-like domain-containing protein, partial [Terriglobales bacterium]|nr:rhodanese-like domain-containing protein [Terriglobales bacterium]
MHFRQFYVGCLAHASYLVGDGGVAAVVDPARDIGMYLDEASAHGLSIRWVLETHLHADFVSGHRELAARTGATIGLGRHANAEFPHRALFAGDEIELGDVRLRVLETPGHTPESLTFLVFERAGDPTPWAALTGDTLFVGDVGRVDILSSRRPVAKLAGSLYDSLHGKLLALPDETRVYPAHGAGSLCGRGIGAESSSTIGRERATNPALRPMSRADFIAEVTRDVPETPSYFLYSRDLNRAGPPLTADRVLPPALEPIAFAAAADAGAVILDARPGDDYGERHPTRALHVSLDGQFASWVGTLLEPDHPILLLTPSGREEEAMTRLARVGYENIVGTLEGGCDAWRAAGLPVKSTPQVPIARALSEARSVLDVRRVPEWEAGHLEGAIHIPLAQLPRRTNELDREGDWVVICASGYRSAIATSVLERAGFARVANAR